MWNLFLTYLPIVSNPEEPPDDVPVLAAPVVPEADGVAPGIVTAVDGQEYEEVPVEKLETTKLLKSKAKAKLPQPPGAMRPPEPAGPPPKKQKVEPATKQLFLKHGEVKPKVEEEEETALSNDEISKRIFAALVPRLFC